MMANFKRGAGDYMGIAGALNDNASIPAPVRSFLPNDFGLYNMSGNVAEWVADIYRPMTSSTLRDVENHDLNPYRGGRYYELITDENGAPIEKDSLGRLQYRIIADSTVADRENFKRGDVSNYLDGDDAELISYDYGRATLISSKSRVIKGGSWADRLYWLSPGARKFKDEDQSSREIGFRCAMHRVGGPTGNEDPGGLDYGNTGKKKKKRRY
jgi:formylglycine-generating enzyme required for sulfatase activity